MKKLLVVITIAAVAAASLAADAVNQKPRRRPPKGRGGRASGGIVEKAYTGKVFRILNAQTDYAGEPLMKLTKDIRHTALLPIECVQGEVPAGKCPFDVAEQLVATTNVGAGVIVVNDAKLPILTIAPDRRWGILNVTPAKADNPTPEKFAKRFNKLYWNVIARTLGAGTSSYPGCVLTPFSDMSQLDAIAATQPCPEPFNKMIDTGKKYGIGIISIASYRMACEKGWAAAPTNDVQKAIWDEVHAVPKNPMKIEFDPKKGR